MKQARRVSVSSNEFGAVLEIINAHRAKALVSVNVEHLLTNWEIDLPDVQPAAAQIAPMPCVLALTTFTNIVER